MLASNCFNPAGLRTRALRLALFAGVTFGFGAKTLAASQPWRAEQLAWVPASSSAAIGELSKLDVDTLVPQLVASRSLPAGSWTLLRLAPLGRLRLQGAGLAGSKIRAVEALGTDAQALLDLRLEKLKSGAMELLNPSMQSRTYLIGGARRSLDLELTKQASVRPDLVWDQAVAQLLEPAGPKGDQSWIRSSPELQGVLELSADLRKLFPKRRETIEAWSRWALAKTLLKLRPTSMTGWSKQALTPQGASLGTWTWEGQEGRDVTYTRVTGPQTLWVNAKGPGALQLELRALVGAGETAPELSVHAQGVFSDAMQASLSEAKFGCEDKAAHRRCPVQVDDSGLLGVAERRRIALPGAGQTRVRIDVKGGEGLLALRQDRLRPRLGKDPLRRSSLRACDELRTALEEIPAKDPLASLLGALSAGCVTSPTALVKAQAASLESRCAQAKSPAKQVLSKALLQLGEPLVAQRCSESPNQEFGPQAGPSMATLATYFSQLRSDEDAAWSSSLRATFMQGYSQQSRWIRLRPEQEKVPSLSWIIDAKPAQDPSGELWQPAKSWTAIKSGQLYRIQAPLPQGAQPHLSRLDLAWDRAQPPTRVLIDQQPQRIDADTARGAWLLAPGAHQVQVEAAGEAKLFATIQPRQQASPGTAKVLKMWPLGAQDEPLSFALPPGAAALPLQLTLRAKGSASPASGQFLWLRDDQGSKTRIALTGKAFELQDAVALAGQGAISTPLRLEATVSPNATRVWIEGDRKLREQFLVSLRYRGPRELLSTAPAPVPADAPRPKTSPTPPATSNAFVEDPTRQDIVHAKRLLAQKQWGPLRKIFVKWSNQPNKLLKEHRAERLALFNAYRGYIKENADAYKITRQDEFPAVMPASFLGENQTPLPKDASRSLQVAAKDLQRVGQEQAIWAAYRFSASLQKEPEQGSKLWPLAYGLMNLPGYKIDNPRLNALRARSAKHSRWEPLNFAYKSAGYEHIERLGASKSASQQPLGTALEGEPGALSLAPSQTRTYQLEPTKAQDLRLSSFCRSTLGQSEHPSISVSLDDAAAQMYELDQGNGPELVWSVSSGAHTLSVQSSASSRCVVRLESKDAESQVWTTVSMPNKQRWFATGPHRPLSFHAQGPGVLALQTRALGDGSVPAKLLVTRSAEQGATQLRFGLSTVPDSEVLLSRDSKTVVNASSENFVILPEDEVYLVELRSPEREILVRAKSRVPDAPESVQLVKQDWAKTLGAQLSRAPSASASSFPFPVNSVGLRQSFEPASSRWGSFDLAMRSGIERDTQFETIQSRVVSGLFGTYRRELLADRLWLRGQLSAQSQRLAAPMFAGQIQLSGQAKRVPMRVRLGGQFGLQPVLGQLPASGRAWVEVEASLRNAYRRSTTWDLRPSLRLDGRMVGALAQELGPDDDAQLINSSIYRKYAVDHPLALKPKLVWTYRDLRNARVDLGSDLWLNSDFKGLDRTRAWLRFAGIYRRSTPRPSWWIYQAGYRWTYAFVDTHRRSAYMRHALQGQLRFAWQWAKKRRLHLTLADTLLFSDQGFAGNEIRLNLGLRFDPLEAFRHSAPQERRFLGEIARKDWTMVGLR